MNELEDIIKSSIDTSSVTSTGFYQIKCPICETHDKKRAGFVFNDDSIAYNCFKGKCPVGKTKYVYGEYLPRKFRTVLDALGIEVPMNLLLNNKKQETVDIELFDKHSYTKLELPESFKRYSPEHHTFFKQKLEEREIYDTDYYVGTEKEWKGKLIVPFRYKGDLIGWQGVQFFKNGTKYLTSSGNSNLLYLPKGYVPYRPIVVEGAFDAKSMPNCIATLESTITKKQAYILRNSKPILLPDRKGSRYLGIAKKYGWDISIPAWKEKDLNDALIKYGKFITAKMIHDGICKSSFDAETKYGLWRI